MPLTPLRLRLLVVSLLTVSLLGALDHTIVATSLATVAGDLGALEQMSWIVVGYTLASTVLLPVLGKLGDMVGPRWVFLTSLVVFLVASLVCGFAQDMPQLIVARVVQGMSSAGLQLMSQTIIAQVTSPRERPRYLAIIGAAFPIAILIGPVVGGLITDYWGWSWVFWINIPFGLAALGLAVFAIPHIEPSGRRRFDYAGSLAFTTALVALVLAVTWVGSAETGAASVVAFALSAIAFAAFFLIELRTEEPIVPLRLFRNRTIAAGIALSAIIGIGLFSVTAYLPTYFQMAYQTSATVSGHRPHRDGVRDAGQQPRDRVPGQSHRPLPRLRDRRHGAGRRGSVHDVAAPRRRAPLGAGDRHGRRRRRHGCVHEPHRRGRAERRAAQRDGHDHGVHQPRAPGRIDPGHRHHRRDHRRGRRGGGPGGPRRLDADTAIRPRRLARRAGAGGRTLRRRARARLPGARHRLRGRGRRRHPASGRTALGRARTAAPHASSEPVTA